MKIQKSECCEADTILKEIDHLNRYCTNCDELCKEIKTNVNKPKTTREV